MPPVKQTPPLPILLRRVRSLLLALATANLAVALAAPSAAAAEDNGRTFYVSPAGDDAWSGDRADADVARKSGPFRTPARARDAVRELKRKGGGKLPGPVTIRFRGGTYTLAEPFRLTPDDSGFDEAPVTYAAHENESPVISGGIPVKGWQVRIVGGKPAWVAKVPGWTHAPGQPREFWLNGQPRTRARTPGYLAVAEVPDAKPGGAHHVGQTNFRFRGGDIQPIADLAGAELILFTRWVESRLPIEAIDAKDRLVRFGRKTMHTPEVGDSYFLEGAAEFLDQPGEWHFEKKSGTLTYLPKAGEDAAKAAGVLPNLTQVLVLAGEPQRGRFVEHVRFRGLTFSHSEWGLDRPGAPPGRSGYAQAAVGVPGAVSGEGVRRCAFERCTFADAGNYGLVLGRGSTHNVVSRCTFTRLGAGGVRIGDTEPFADPNEQSGRNEVSDSRIVECGHLFPSSVGVWIGHASANRIAYNEIADLSYTGISVGWTWGYKPAQCAGNVIEHNHVHHIGGRSGGRDTVLSDMGGIYTLGHQPGAVIRYNRFHDIAGKNYGGWGIYFDEGSAQILAEKNVVYRTTHGGFHQHYGRDNVVRNNVFALAKVHQVQRTRPEEHRSFTFERNVVYWSEGAVLGGNWEGYNVAFDRNVYGRTVAGDFPFGPLTFAQWQEKKLDRNSLLADPKFVELALDNFNLKSDSPALKLGFEPWDQAAVGPRK